jgi:nucleoredoxin
MAAFVELLGGKLLGPDGDVDTSSLEGKTVGLYFSAHWCPPCRGFTPQLSEWYKKDLKNRGLEVVFVSSDRDEASFKGYFDEMPWLALPYADRERKDKLSKQFKVKGIPSFVILNPNGEVITTDGRAAVSEDPTGAEFPWTPQPFTLGESFLGKDGEVPASALASKVKLLYFSAHWCPPCRGFTPQLAKAYQGWMQKGLNVEVVFVTGDRDEASFQEYFNEMPWLALPFGDKRCKAWNKAFEVSGIPTVVILDEENNVINKDGRGAISSDFEGKSFPWHPPLVSDLENPDGINGTLSIVVLMETLSLPEQENVLSVMKPLAEKYRAEAKATGGDAKYLFFSATQPGSVSARVRALTKQENVPASHKHPLATADAAGGWGCDGCSKNGDECQGRNRCTEGCDFDLCDACNALASKPVEPMPAKVLLLDLENDSFFQLESQLSAESLSQFFLDFEAGVLPKKSI